MSMTPSAADELAKRIIKNCYRHIGCRKAPFQAADEYHLLNGFCQIPGTGIATRQDGAISFLVPLPAGTESVVTFKGGGVKEERPGPVYQNVPVVVREVSPGVIRVWLRDERSIFLELGDQQQERDYWHGIMNGLGLGALIQVD